MSSKAERFAALQARRADDLAERLGRLLDLRGDERALDVGAGVGALAFALAPHVGSVTALDADPAMGARARADAPPNVEAVVGDGEALPFADGSFDLAGTLRTLHHPAGPERLVAELVRVTRPGAQVLVADQLAPEDGAEALNAFERARDGSTTRVLTEPELRALLAAAGLRVEQVEIVRDPRDLDAYLGLAGCTGVERERAKALAPPGYEAILGWFACRRG
jgi:ubiquinone/menaquinone biosynthesis C-methylase UbiE